MQTHKILAVGLLGCLVSLGCGIKSKNGKSHLRKAQSKDASTATKAQIQNSIEVTKITPLVIRAGNENGAYIGDNIEAIDKKTGNEIVEFSYGSPKWGSLKSYPNGHSRYYPPQRACKDELEVILISKNGERKTIVLPIDVLSANSEISETSNPEVSQMEVSQPTMSADLTSITLPKANARLKGVVCKVQGTSNLPNGSKLILMVKNQWDIDYEQNNYPIVTNGQFSGVVYLGEEPYGIGEKFTIWTIDASGRKSQQVTVTRIS